jgi:hypothetical protein
MHHACLFPTGRRNIFGEFMRFFPKGLYPFVIQAKFKSDLFPEFVFHILLGI